MNFRFSPSARLAEESHARNNTRLARELSLSLNMTEYFLSFRTLIWNLSMLVILYWGLCNPKPRTKYFFFSIAKKKERILDNKEKQRRLKTVTKFNPKLVNSLSLRQHEFFIVSLSDCNQFLHAV